MNPKFYAFARVILNIYFGLCFPCRLIGKGNIPAEGACIVSSNHISAADPFYIAMRTQRHVYFMAKVELFKNKILACLITMLGAFPINRGQADLNAIRTSLKILKEGHVLGIFPQGTRSRDNEQTQMEGGIALIALRAGVPVVPVYIDGPYRLFRKTALVIGEPVDLSDFGRKCDSATIAQATERIEKAIWSLKEKV